LGDCFLWAVFLNTKISPNFLLHFAVEKMYTLILRKVGLDHILGDFLTNSSGHPAENAKRASVQIEPESGA
jgi:hypothetical protein